MGFHSNRSVKLISIFWVCLLQNYFYCLTIIWVG